VVPDSAHMLVPAGEGRAIRIAAGELAHIIDEAGGQVVDTWAFCQQDISEFHSAEHTRASVGKLFPALGEAFVTNRRRPILRYEEDHSPGTHDMLIAACDPTRYEQLGFMGWHASCEENLRSAMAAVGHSDVCVPQPINVFMNTPFLPDGNVRWLSTRTGIGDSVTLRALLDIWLVASACPQDLIDINAKRGSIRVTVARGSEPVPRRLSDAS
jgi:uncharacterized protein YcgI (DUF1989 family)